MSAENTDETPGAPRQNSAIERTGPVVPSCATCRYSHPRTGYELLECRRYAPRAGTEPAHLGERTRWPQVTAGDWCGECDTPGHVFGLLRARAASPQP